MTNAADRREWDAPAYDTLNAPMTARGNDAVARLELRGDETVLDAGCGTGQVTATLLERLPRGRAIALDGSLRMLDAARERLGGDPRVAFVQADLGEPLVPPLERDAVDAIVSTSTFHWVRDHAALFRNLAAVLRPGGQLVAQCGGAGNIASVHGALRKVGETWAGATYFASPEETIPRLTAAGFEGIEAWLQATPTRLEPGRELEEFLATITLGPHLERRPPHERAAFVHAVATAMPKPEIDYVRLNIVARRSAD